MLLTHFEAVHAREAYPCFDEPGFKAKFQLSVLHPNSTVILSNWDESVNETNRCVQIESNKIDVF